MKKVAITQDLCRMVELMLKGGAQQKEVGERLGISKATVSRIKTAGFDYGTFLKNTEQRRIEQKNARADAAIERINAEINKVREAEAQTVPGQIRMEIPEKPLEAEKPEMSEQVKMMRFIAGQVDRIVKALGEVLAAVKES